MCLGITNMFATKPSVKKVTKYDPAVEEAVRYCMIALPADGGKQFPMMVDGRKITFTAPKGAKKGQEVEFAFTFKGGQVLSPPYTIDADLESTPSTLVAMAEDEPVLKSSVKSSEPMELAELANAMTSKVLEQHAVSAEARISKAVAEDVSPKLLDGASSAKTAFETAANDAAVAAVEPAKQPIVAMAEEEPVLKSSAKSSEPIDYKELAKATTSNVLDVAVTAVEERAKLPIVAMAKDEPIVLPLGMRDLMVALVLLLAMAVVIKT